MTERPEQNPFEGFREAYQQFLDETANFVRQPMQSVREISNAMIDAQRDAIHGIEDNAMLAPWKNMLTMEYRFLEFYTRQASLGMSMANRATEAFFDTASAWGRGMRQAQQSFSRSAEQAQRELGRGVQEAQREMGRTTEEAQRSQRAGEAGPTTPSKKSP